MWTPPGHPLCLHVNNRWLKLISALVDNRVMAAPVLYSWPCVPVMFQCLFIHTDTRTRFHSWQAQHVLCSCITCAFSMREIRGSSMFLQASPGECAVASGLRAVLYFGRCLIYSLQQNTGESTGGYISDLRGSSEVQLNSHCPSSLSFLYFASCPHLNPRLLCTPDLAGLSCCE